MGISVSGVLSGSVKSAKTNVTTFALLMLNMDTRPSNISKHEYELVKAAFYQMIVTFIGSIWFPFWVSSIVTFIFILLAITYPRK